MNYKIFENRLKYLKKTYGTDLWSMNVSANDSRIDPNLALETAPYFGLDKEQARAEVNRILSLVRRDWRTVASECGLNRAAINYMEPAFSLPDHLD